MEFKYLKRIHELINTIENKEKSSMEECVNLLAEAVLNKNSIIKQLTYKTFLYHEKEICKNHVPINGITSN